MIDNADIIRELLCDLGDHIRDRIVAERLRAGYEDFSTITEVTTADTIYAIDKISEEVIFEWFRDHWPEDRPVELVMEGLEGKSAVVFPNGVPLSHTELKCIMDPIDGTRNLMYDKRSAWVLAAVAPQRGNDNTLKDLVVAAMTELPTAKQTMSDQVSGIRGEGREGMVAERINLPDRSEKPIELRLSQADDFKHGFASISKFFPEGKSLLAQVEEDVWDALYGLGTSASPLVFDDQYIATGGQIYELLMGHDRMLCDMRPYALEKLGYETSLVCHPYDICTAFLLEEAGGVLEKPAGGELDAPLDTISPVSWIGYANRTLAEQFRPVLAKAIEKHFGKR